MAQKARQFMLKDLILMTTESVDVGDIFQNSDTREDNNETLLYTKYQWT